MFTPSFDNFPRLYSYSRARRHHDETPPLRGRPVEIRPLRVDRRRGDEYSIRMIGEDVIVQMYYTRLLTFRPDGSVVVNFNGYSGSPTTRRLVAYLLDVDVREHRGHLVFGGKYIVDPSEPFTWRDGAVEPDRVGVFLCRGRRVLPKYKPYYRSIRDDLAQWRKDHAAVKKFWPSWKTGIFVPGSDLDKVLSLPREERAQYEPPPGSDYVLARMRYEIRREAPKSGDFHVISKKEAAEMVANGDAWPLED